MPAWLLTSSTDLWAVLPSTVAVYAGVLLVTRLVGVRSLAKLSTFDFAATVAIGTLLANTAINPGVPLLPALLGLVLLYALQALLAHLRRGVGAARIVDNPPRVLMVGGELVEDALDRAGVAPGEVYAQLRGQGVTDPDREVLAVVIESTGDISVLPRHDDRAPDPTVLQGVVGGERLLEAS